MEVLRSELKQELAVTMSITNAAIGISVLLPGTTVPEDSPIKYTNVLANKGDRYDPSTGKFTADRPGLYYSNIL